MANAISKAFILLSKVIKGLQNPRYSVLPWNNRFYLKNIIFLERHHKKLELHNSTYVEYTAENDQWTQGLKRSTKLRILPYGCLALFFSFFSIVYLN